MSTLQKDLDSINDIATEFLHYTTSGINNQVQCLQFLLKSRGFYENIETIIAKPFQTSIDVYPYDLPRELTEKRMELEKIKSIEKVLEFKDEVIYQLLNTRETKLQQLKENMEKAASEEITEWSKLTDKFASELKKYQLVCHFCGVALDQGSVNEQCRLNQQSVKQTEQYLLQGYTNKKPDFNFYGNHSHFFAEPNNHILTTNLYNNNNPPLQNPH